MAARESSDEGVADRALGVIAAYLEKPREEISLDATFEELGIDSLGGSALVFDLEEEFEISIPNEQALEIRSVKQAIEILTTNLAGDGTAS